MTGEVSNPDIGLFTQTMQVAHSILPVVVAGTIAFLIITTLLADTIIPQPFLIGVTTGLILYPTCMNVLTGGAMQGRDLYREKAPGTLSIFIVTYALLWIVVFGVNAIAAVVFGVQSGTTGLVGLLANVAFMLGLARYGTVLPAIVEGGDKSLKAASTRARMWPVFWRLLVSGLIGEGAAFAAGMVFLLAGTILGEGVAPLLLVLARFVATACIVCTLVAMGVILCNAYRGYYR